MKITLTPTYHKGVEFTLKIEGMSRDQLEMLKDHLDRAKESVTIHTIRSVIGSELVRFDGPAPEVPYTEETFKKLQALPKVPDVVVPEDDDL
jgi:hypothetical protein